MPPSAPPTIPPLTSLNSIAEQLFSATRYRNHDMQSWMQKPNTLPISVQNASISAMTRGVTAASS